MAKLTTAARKKSRLRVLRVRIDHIRSKSHARNALSRVSQNGSPALKARVRAKVHAKYPNMGKPGAAKAHGHGAVKNWTNG